MPNTDIFSGALKKLRTMLYNIPMAVIEWFYLDRGITIIQMHSNFKDSNKTGYNCNIIFVSISESPTLLKNINNSQHKYRMIFVIML